MESGDGSGMDVVHLTQTYDESGHLYGVVTDYHSSALGSISGSIPDGQLGYFSDYSQYFFIFYDF